MNSSKKEKKSPPRFKDLKSTKGSVRGGAVLNLNQTAYSQVQETVSNVCKAESNTASTIIQNMKG